MHHGNAVLQSFLGILEIDLLAFQVDVAGVLAINAEEAFHQGGFARTVFSHQRVNRTGPHRQVDTVQGLDTGEFLGDALHPQQDGFIVLIQIIRLLIWGTSSSRRAAGERSGSFLSA